MLRLGRFNPLLRRLVQADLPVSARTESEVSAERDRNYRWNFTVNTLEVASFWFGLSFISGSTVVPLFISKLTDSPIAIGLAALIAQGSWHLPQIFTANYVERLPRKKPIVVNLGFFTERLPVWFLVLAAVAAAGSPILALWLFLLAYAWHGFGAGLVATAWQDLIARCFPVNRRGRFFGTALFVGGATGALAAGVSARLLERFAFPTNFTVSFIVAALFITVSWFLLALTREPVNTASAPRKSQRQFLAEVPDILRQDRNFQHFLVARLLLALGGMGIGFVTVAAVRRWQVADGVVGGYTAALLAGQTFGNLAFGLLADRRGHKLSLEFGGFLTFLAFALAWLAPAESWYFVVFALIGAMQGAVIVSGILVVMEFSSPERRPTYAGLTNTAVGLVSIAGPIIGAGLAAASYDGLFALSAFVGLLALVLMRWWVTEPRTVTG